MALAAAPPNQGPPGITVLAFHPWAPKTVLLGHVRKEQYRVRSSSGFPGITPPRLSHDACTGILGDLSSASELLPSIRLVPVGSQNSPLPSCRNRSKGSRRPSAKSIGLLLEHGG